MIQLVRALAAKGLHSVPPPEVYIVEGKNELLKVCLYSVSPPHTHTVGEIMNE